MPGALPVACHQLTVGERRLRVFVEVFHVGMGGCRVQVKIVLLDIFSVIPLVIGQTKEPFFEDGITPVPQRQYKAQPLMVVGKPGQTVFAPAVGSRTRLVVGGEIPGGARRAIVFSDGAPLTLGHVWPPAPPVGGTLLGCLESQCFVCHIRSFLPQSILCAILPYARQDSSALLV